MRKIVLLLAILAVVYGQELVIDSLNGAYTSGTEYYKYYKYSKWNNVKDFAVYGWFKFGSQYARNEWATIFHMTSNEADWTNYTKPGDRVLAFFTIGATLHNPTYSVARGNNNYYEDQAYAANDLDKWAFFYVAHSGADSAQFAYYNLAGSGIKSKKITQITHNTSSYYRINVGHSFDYRYVPGNLWRVTIQGGDGAYRESNFEAITNVTPSSLPTCPTVYSGYAYTGVATNVCQSVPTYDVRSIHSVYVPSGYTVTVYDSNNFAGKKITYNQSIESIDEHNWALLVAEKAITIENDDRVALRR